MELPVPSFFDPSKADDIWRVPYDARAAEAATWAKTHGIKPAASRRTRIALLGIDQQNTFCTPGAELFVGGRSGNGAVEDSVRFCEFIYRNLHLITGIYLTMDTHRTMQIFHPYWWVDAGGKHPDPMTIITEEDVNQGKWLVNPAIAWSVAQGNHVGLRMQGAHYVKKLAEGGRYPLIIWPYHAMLGGVGHALVASVEEAAFFHAVAACSQTNFEIKGGNPLCENYSVFCPEVTEGPGGPIDERNTVFLNTLMSNDIVIIGGQAKSHCVAWTISDLLKEIDPTLAAKCYLLDDCSSSVVVPGVIDFTQQADDHFARFAAAGMHVVRSTTPIEQWPGVTL